MFLRDSVYSTLFPYLPQQQPATPVVADGDGTSQPAQPTPVALAPIADENGNSLPVGQADLTGFDPSSMGPSVWTGVQATPQPMQPAADQPAIPGGGYVEPTASPAAMALMPAIQKDGTDTTGRHAAFSDPLPQMPDYSSLPPAERNYQEAVWNSQHAENKDHGIKGHLSQLLGNFLYSMGQAYAQNPLISPGALLAVGGVGAGAGEVKPQWNERRMAMSQVPMLRQAATDEQTARMRQGQLGNYASLDESRKAAAQNRADANQIKVQEILSKHDDHMHRDLITLAKQYPYLDSSDPDQQPIFDAFEKAGMPLADRNSKVIVSLAHDEKTGQWVKTVTDPYRGGQSTSEVIKGPDGKPLVTESIAQLGADSREKVADINAKSRKYAADTSAATSRYSTDARTQLATITDLNKLQQTRTVLAMMSPPKGSDVDAFKKKQQEQLDAIDARIGELQKR